MQLDRLSMLLGLAGIGAIAFGGLMIYNQTQAQKAAGISGAVFGRKKGKQRLITQESLGRWWGKDDPSKNLVTKRYAEAPVVSRKSSNGMKTTIRESSDMPIEQRLATIQRLIYEGAQDPEMRKLALQITRNCPERDKKCEAKAIYDYTKGNIRYTGDIAPILAPDGSVDGIDLYQSGKRTALDLKGGDCDDHSILNATLLSLNGIESRLRVTAEDKRSDWSHIYCGALLDNKFVALDTTLPGHDNFGYEVPFAKNLDFHA